jgi:hypothetical protein
MEEMKSRITILCGLLLVFLVIFMFQKPAFAIPGQLNNGFASPTPPPSGIVVTPPDAGALDECNQKYAQAQTALKNCQDTAAVTVKTDKQGNSGSPIFLIWALVSTMLVFILGGMLISTMFEKKKTIPPSPPITPPLP